MDNALLESYETDFDCDMEILIKKQAKYFNLQPQLIDNSQKALTLVKPMQERPS
jgi:hypothetical protein